MFNVAPPLTCSHLRRCLVAAHCSGAHSRNDFVIVAVGGDAVAVAVRTQSRRGSFVFACQSQQLHRRSARAIWNVYVHADSRSPAREPPALPRIKADGRAAERLVHTTPPAHNNSLLRVAAKYNEWPAAISGRLLHRRRGSRQVASVPIASG